MMRNIVKSAEPRSLKQHRCSVHADYDNYSDKDSLRKSLVAEQRGLCCYCLSRLIADLQHMKIEHWQSQARFPQRQLDYSNLLGACLGGKGKPPKFQHCDTRKEELDLSMNPADPAHDVERVIRYDPNGPIRSTGPVLDREINEVLNLNAPLLKNNRAAVLTGFLQSGPKTGNWNEAFLRKKVKQWSGESG